MAKKALGLDLDFSTIRAVEVARKGRNKVVTKLAERTLPPGTVSDGKLVNPGEFVRSLDALVKAEGFSAEATVVGVRSAWVTVKTHRLPSMSKRELDKALEFEVPELIPGSNGSLKEISYDYFVNMQDENELEVVVVACPRQHLNPYVRAFKELPLSLEAIDLPALGWPELITGQGRRAFVEISEGQTTIMVVFGQLFKVLRVVPIGNLHVKQGVQEAFGCLAQEAADLMARHDLDYLLTNGQGSKRMLRAAVQQFAGSVLQTLDFVRAQERAGSFKAMLDEVVLLGDFAEMSGLGDMLGKEIDLPVHVLANLDLNVSFAEGKPERLSSFASALVLGVRGLDV